MREGWAVPPGFVGLLAIRPRQRDHADALSRAARAERYRGGARKGEEDRAHGREIRDWSDEEWGAAGRLSWWSGYWAARNGDYEDGYWTGADADDDEDDAWDEVYLPKQFVRFAAGGVVAALVVVPAVLRGRWLRRARTEREHPRP